jgi:hypothetical protein
MTERTDAGCVNACRSYTATDRRLHHGVSTRRQSVQLTPSDPTLGRQGHSSARGPIDQCWCSDVSFCDSRQMSAWVPLFQTLVWAALIVSVLVFLRGPLKAIVKAISERVAGGGGFEASVAGAFGIKIYELQELKHVDPTRAVDGTPPVEAAWTKSRDEQKRSSRELYLVHVISPSRRGSGWFDIFVFIVGPRRARHSFPEDMADVLKAEFFLGRHWGNKIFIVQNSGDGKRIGLATSAYGPTLCICRIHFRDGQMAVLSRYLDFEMAPAIADQRIHAGSATE